MLVKPKALDILAFLAALVVIGLIAIRVYASADRKPLVHIKGPGKEWIQPLDEPTQLAVSGPLGETVIGVQNGTLQVLSSPCREQICVRSRPISRPGQWIACLPNQVFIHIRGKKEPVIDAYSF